jgi:predicted O-methyltransferase YrrM
MMVSMIALEDLLARPPALHAGGTTWGISLRLAHFLDAAVEPGASTLEIGAGLSTIIMLRRGVARHISVTPYGAEFDAIRASCARMGIDATPLEAVCLSSQAYLPTAPLPALDLVLIDGAHGFPGPFVDWYYTVESLRIGGLMVVDDLQLVTGHIMADFMRADAKWDEVVRDDRFAVYRKRAHPIHDDRDWLAQAYLVRSNPVAAVRVVRAGPVRRLVRLARQAWAEPSLVSNRLRALASRNRYSGGRT